MAEEKEAGRKRRARGGHKGANGLANGGRNGREAGKPRASGGAVSPVQNKKRRQSGVTDAVREVVRRSPVLSIMAAFAAGIIIGFRPGSR